MIIMLVSYDYFIFLFRHMEPLMFKIFIPFGCLMIIVNMSVSYDYILLKRNGKVNILGSYTKLISVIKSCDGLNPF
ncbi:hypothetical protein D7D25_08490 [Proteiniphilum sp. X52]|nr:hypothetical protein D7D25_08490 [Proteiniphilum sp. X52]